MSGDQNGVDVLSIENLPVIVVNIGLFDLALVHGELAAFVEHIGRGGKHRVVLVGFVVNSHEMILADAEPDTNDRDGDAIVGAGDVCRRRLVLAINRCFNDRGGSQRSRGSRCFLYEIPARDPAGRRGGWLFHNNLFQLPYHYYY